MRQPQPASHRMEKFLVADCYVPAKDRSWNEQEALLTVQPVRAVANSESQADMLRSVICPSVPVVSHDAMVRAGQQFKREQLARQLQQQLQQPPNSAPPPPPPSQSAVVSRFGVPCRILPLDTHFAVQHNLQARSMSQGQRQQQHNKDDELPSLESLVNNTKDQSLESELISKYCDALVCLLFAERKETLLLYERYSQYQCKTVSFSPAPKHDYQTSGRSCFIDIAGIADAAPAVRAGDSVLLRACEMSTPRRPGLRHRKVGVIEVQCQVVQLARGRGAQNAYDRISATWLETQQIQNLSQQVFALPQALTRNHQPLNVRIVPSPIPFVRCLTAVDWLRSTCMALDVGNPQQEPHPLQELLFPTRAPLLPPIPDHDMFFHDDGKDQLNAQQELFVRSAMQRAIHPTRDNTRGPLILTGPAGTGKTRTMLAAIQRVLALNSTTQHNNNNGDRNHRRILVCTPSHTAANVITRRLASFLGADKLFRLLDASRPNSTYPLALLPFCCQDEKTGQFMLPPLERLFQCDVIVSTCSDAHLLYRAGFTNQQLRIHRQNVLTGIQPQLQSCGMSLGSDLIQSAATPHFSHLFIDEAAQATEAETLVPLSVVADPLGDKKVEVALVGDPRQLSPQVFCSKASKAGLGQSWIERLLRQSADCTGGGSQTLLGPNPNTMEELLKFSLQSTNSLSVFLTANYRGHPSFLALPSALFYSDMLQSAPPSLHKAQASKGKGSLKIHLEPQEWVEKLRMVESLSIPVIPSKKDEGGDDVVLEELLVPRKQYGFPIHFRGVVGNDVSVTVSSSFAGDSWMNKEEAETVVEIIKCLISKSQQDGVAIPPQSIGVMAPFRGQVDLIRKLLRQERLGGVDVGTIEDYQAVEWDVIVLSLTRSLSSLVQHDISRRLGVFGQPKRSNVALTRAENMFIVVGNPNIMMEHFVWRQFLLFCHRNGLWYGAKNDIREFSNAVVTSNLQDLANVNRREPSLEKQFNKMALSVPPTATHQHGVIVSTLERSLRSSSIV